MFPPELKSVRSAGWLDENTDVTDISQQMVSSLAAYEGFSIYEECLKKPSFG